MHEMIILSSLSDIHYIGTMPPKKGRRRRTKEEDSDEEEIGPLRKGSKKKDEDYIWDEDQGEAALESSKKGRKKKNAVVWNDNDCRADVCLRPPGTSRFFVLCYFSCMFSLLGGFVATPAVAGSTYLASSCQRSSSPCSTLRRSTTAPTVSRIRSRC